MRHLLLVLALAAAAVIATHAQVDVVTVEVDSGQTCPAGWTTVDEAWTQPAKINYVLPEAQVTAWRHIYRWQYDTVEFQVTQTFVDAVWPTPTQQQAAYANGRLRSEPATSGTVTTCSLP